MMAASYLDMTPVPATRSLRLKADTMATHDLPDPRIMSSAAFSTRANYARLMPAQYALLRMHGYGQVEAFA